MKMTIKSSRPLVHFSNKGQKWPKSDFQCEFSKLRIIQKKFFSVKNDTLGEKTFLKLFFDNFIF